MATNKDYYEILGVSKNASEEDIKKAYRKMAREHDPDVAKNKEEAEAKFKEINEAYQVLINKDKRAQYDRFGSSAFSNGGGKNPYGGFDGQNPFGGFSYTWSSSNQNQGFSDFDPFDIFEEVFGFRGFGGRAPRRGKNLYYRLQISFAESIKGVSKKIRVENDEFEVKIPAGVSSGTELKVTGRGGEAPQKGLPKGDLFLNIEVADVPYFLRQGADLVSQVEIKLTQAVLGDTITIKGIDLKSNDGIGDIKLKIPAGCQNNTTFKISGAGIPKLRGSGRGDHYVKIVILIPSKINGKQKDLFAALKDSGL